MARCFQFVLVLLGLVLLVSGSATCSEGRPRKQARYLMGTVCEITAYSTPGDDQKTDAAINAAFDELKRIDALLSNWKPDSELMRMNASAGSAAGDGVRPKIPVSGELFERIQVALRMAEATDGHFDPTVGPLVRAWGFLPSDTKPGSRDQAIAAARSRVGWKKITLDAYEHSIKFAVPGMEIDLGGIAKGYAAQKAAQVLRSYGVQTALVSLGGSSIAAIGSPPGTTGWPVFIRDPRDGETPAAWLELRDGESLATSGTYEKTVGEGKARRSHIMDPATGQAVGGAVSVTVLLDDAETADALTKPFFLIPAHSEADWSKWLARFPKASIILLTAQGRELKRIAGGADPQRFWRPASENERQHAAKTDRRSAHNFARNDSRGRGHPAPAPETCGPETYGAARHYPAHLPGNP
jgi:thiamine biosynthesis lipoprotein